MTVALGLCIHGDPGPDTDDGFDGHPAVAVDRLLRSYGTKDWDEAAHPRGAGGRFGVGDDAAVYHHLSLTGVAPGAHADWVHVGDEDSALDRARQVGRYLREGGEAAQAVQDHILHGEPFAPTMYRVQIDGEPLNDATSLVSDRFANAVTKPGTLEERLDRGKEVILRHRDWASEWLNQQYVPAQIDVWRKLAAGQTGPILYQNTGENTWQPSVVTPAETVHVLDAEDREPMLPDHPAGYLAAARAYDDELRNTKDFNEADHPRGADGRFGDGAAAAPAAPPAKDPLRFADTARRVDQADSLGEQDWRTFGGATRMGGVWQTTQEMNRIVRQTLDYAAKNGGSINRQTVIDANVGFEGEPSPPTAADMQEMANCMCQNGGYTPVDYLNDIKACAVYIRGGQRQAPLNTDDLHRGIIVPRKVLDQIVADGKVTLRNSSWSASKTAASVFAGKRNPFVAAEDAPKVRRGQVGVMLQLPPGSARALPVNGPRGYDRMREHVVSGTFAIDHVTTDTDGQTTLHLKAAEA